MKKLISMLLCIVLVLSALPLGALEAAASGRFYADTEYSIYCSSAGTWDVGTFVPSKTGVYVFSSSGSYDTIGYIALEEGMAENEYIKADGGQGNNFAVTMEMNAGTTYYLGSSILTGSGTYRVKITELIVDDDTIYPLPLGTSTSVTTNKSKGIKYYSFTPTRSGKYVYYSSGSCDTQGYVYDDYWRQIGYSDDSDSTYNFKVTLDLQAGKKYYLGYAVSSTANATFSLTIFMSSYIQGVSLASSPNKTVYYKNLDAVAAGSGKFKVNLQLRGFEFTIHYSNGEEATKAFAYNMRGLTLNASVTLKEGDNNVPFSYMSYSSYFVITVEDPPIDHLELVRLPDKTVYYEEDSETAINEERIYNVSLYGLVFKVYYNNGSSTNVRISSAYGEEVEHLYFDHVVKAEDMHLGANTFTLTYFGNELSFNVTLAYNADNWEYDYVDDLVRLTKYIGPGGSVIIPGTLNNKTVIAIGDNCFKERTDITSVRMSETITQIGKNAFFGCSGIEELTLPASLTTLGAQALYGTTGLKRLYWNSSYLTIDPNDNIFAKMGEDVAQGTRVEFGYECTAIPETALSVSIETDYPHVTEIIIGENVTSIGTLAFQSLPALARVEWNAIALTTALVSSSYLWYDSAVDSSFEVYIGENVREIPNFAFFASKDTGVNAPRISKIQVANKDTVIFEKSVKTRRDIPLTYYCYYNADQTVDSVYRYCLSNSLNYELLDARITSLYFRSLPEKTEYIIGDAFESDGLSVTAVFSDGTEEDVTDLVSLSGYDGDSIGTQTITVSYSHIIDTLTATFTVRVSAVPLVLESISITHAADKTTFFTGDNFESTGLEVTAQFTDGSEQDVTDYVILSGYNMFEEGEQSVTITYTYAEVTRQAAYTIFLTQLVLKRIDVTTLPDKTDYVLGETLNLDGVVVTATYTSGNTLPVTALCTFSGDASSTGTRRIIATYSEDGITKTAAFEISVHNHPTSLTLNALPAKCSYFVGEAFESAGISATAAFENGTSADVTEAITFSGNDTSTPGEKSVTVTYTAGGVRAEASFTITVSEICVTELTLISAPTATQYINEALDTTGLSIRAVLSDGSAIDVTEQADLSGFDQSVAGLQTITATYAQGGTEESVTFTVDVIARQAIGIEITAAPQKTSYYIGDALDISGLCVNLLFDAGPAKALSTDALSLSGYQASVPGAQSVVVGYTYLGESFTDSFAVTLINYETALLLTAPIKTHYYYGDALQSDGMRIALQMADGSETVLTEGYTMSVYNPYQLGTQTVIVDYTSPLTSAHFSDSFELTVANFATALHVSAPTKTDYFYGDDLDMAGFDATLELANGESISVAQEALNLSGFDGTVLGTRTLTATYTNEKGDVLSDGFAVTVSNYETALTVTAPQQTEYYYGEVFNPEGLCATACMADGSFVPLSLSALRLSAFDSTATGSQEMTVSFTGAKGNILTDTFTVTILNFETALRVTAPAKTAYYYGEPLDLTGFAATLIMADGSTDAVPLTALTLSAYDAEALGTQTIAVSFLGVKGEVLTDSFAVSVSNYETALAVTAPTQTSCFYGDTLNMTGFEATLTMADGSAVPVAQSVLSFSAFDGTVLGTQTISVSYTNVKGTVLSDSFDVSVSNYETALALTAPTQTDYFYGDALLLDGLGATATMADGATRTIEPAALTVSDFQSTALGAQTITVSFTNAKGTVLSADFAVNVQNYALSLTLTAPTKTSYFYGETPDMSGLRVIANMASGAKKTLSAAEYSVDAIDTAQLGSQTVTVRYTNEKGAVLSNAFTVTVTNFQTRIDVTAPTQIEYFYGDALNTSGMSAKTVSPDGTEQSIDVSKLILSGYDAHLLGEQTVTASFTNEKGEVLSDTFRVTVQNYESAITIRLGNQNCFYGEAINPDNLVLTATMADGTSELRDAASLRLMGFNKNKLGQQNVYGMFTNAKGSNLTATFSVTIINYACALTASVAENTVCYYGDAFDDAALTATLQMADGSSGSIQATDLLISGYDATKLGRQTLTLQYENEKGERLQASITLTLRNFAAALHIGAPTKTVYYLGDTLDLSDLTATLIMADGTQQALSPAALAVTGFDTAHRGTQSILCTFTNEKDEALSDSFEVAVYDPAITYTVTFHPNGAAAIATQTVSEGGFAAKPDDPMRAYYRFDGWYQNEALSEPFDFDTRIFANTDIYEKWTETAHHWSDAQVSVEPTCTETGEKIKTCLNCGETRTETLAALGHDITFHAGVAASCTSAGNKAHYSCARCGNYYEDAQASTRIADKNSVVLPALDHDWGEWQVTTPATCTGAGEETCYCTRDNAHTKTRTIAKLGHQMSFHASTAPTCTQAGNTAYYSCARCDGFYEDAQATTLIADKTSVVVSALGHDMTFRASVAATCTEAGNAAYYACSRCERYFNDLAGTNEIADKTAVILPALDHDWGEWAVTTAPTCTSAGEKTRYCSRDRAHVQTEAVDALGHDMTFHASVAATCTEAGNTAYYACSRCERYFSDLAGTNEIADKTAVILPALDHDWGEWTVTTAPSCTSAGEKTRYCSRDRAHVQTEAVDALGHDMTFHAGVTATCTAAGNTAYYACSRCECYFSDLAGTNEIADKTAVILPALDHDWGEWTVTTAPTCTEAGEETRCCSRDNTHTQTRPVAALDHDWGEWTVTTAPSCTSAGEKTRYCSRDRAHVQTETVDALGHDMTFHAGVTATCTAAGNAPYYTCSRCENSYTDANGSARITDMATLVIPATGHRFEITEQYCLNGCGTANPDYVPPHVHNYTPVVTPPSCLAQGFTTYTCACGDSYVDDYTEALGHNYLPEVTAPTATALGYTTHICSRCPESYIDSYTAPTGKQTLKHAARNASAIKVQWNKVKTATGYQVQISTKDRKKWDAYANVKAGTTVYTFKSLAAGNAYKFRVRFYIKAADGKNYYSPWSAALTSPTLPSGTTLTKLTGASKAFTAQWKKQANATGYQIQYGLKSNFSGAKTLTLKNVKTLKATIKSLSAKKTYYVRIRTYKTISKVNYFSDWSKTYKVKTK